MSQSPSTQLPITQRRAMLYKAVSEHPDNKRIVNALLKTHSAQHIQAAAQKGVYINYNANDDLFALELDDELRDVNINVWLDQIDVEPDEDWDYAVSSALNRSGVMVVILSPNALNDEKLRNDTRAFLEAGKIVIPVLHQKCDVSGLRLVLPPIPFHEDFQLGFQHLTKAFATTPPVSA